MDGSNTGASQIIRAYLDAMEARDLEKAKAFLGPGFAMEFPGPARLTTLEELVAWSKPRYQKVGKTYERFDEAPGDGEAIVYCFGTLFGVWLDDTEFSGIRFIDRFTVKNGLITDQKVWNDMGEVRGAG